MRFVAIMVVKMLMVVFWVVMMCGLIGRYQHSRGNSALKMEIVCSLKTFLSTY
jgi:hypothetical protein